MLSSMTPSIVEKEGKLFSCVRIPWRFNYSHNGFQVIVNVLDFGMSIGQAVNAGRFHHQWLPDWISFEKMRLTAFLLKSLQIWVIY